MNMFYYKNIYYSNVIFSNPKWDNFMLRGGKMYACKG